MSDNEFPEPKSDEQDSQPVPARRLSETNANWAETGRHPLPVIDVKPRFAPDAPQEPPRKLIRTQPILLEPEPPTMTQRQRLLSLVLPALMFGGVTIALLITGLFLPPVSLWDRIDERFSSSSGGQTLPTPTIQSVPLGTRLVNGMLFSEFTGTLPETSVEGLRMGTASNLITQSFGLHIETITAQDYLNQVYPDQGWNCATNLPQRYALVGQVYSITQYGTPPDFIGIIIDVPEGIDTGDTTLFGWNETTGQWEFLPSTPLVRVQKRSAQIDYVPRCMALFRGAESARTVGIALDLGDTFDPDVLATNPRIYPGRLRPTATGALFIILAPDVQTDQGYDVVPMIQNFDDPNVIDIATIQGILENPVLRSEHARQIAAFALSPNSGYAGVAIDYRSVPGDLIANYTAFIEELAGLLHSENLTLSVVLPSPVFEAGFEPDEGGYDWSEIGRLADEVIILMPTNPLSYITDQPADELLAWATANVPQDKLLMGLSALSVEESSSQQRTSVELDVIIDHLRAMSLVAPDTVVPGEQINARLLPPSDINVNLGRALAVRTTFFLYEDTASDTSRAFWLTDSDALHFRLSWAERYNLKGAFVWGLLSEKTVADLENALLAYQLDNDNLVQSYDPEITWVVREDDTVLATATTALAEPVAFQSFAGPELVTIETYFNNQLLHSHDIRIDLAVD